MRISPTDAVAADVAQRIRAGEPVLFLIGSYLSYRESGIPGVGQIVNKIREGLIRHPALASLPPWVFAPVNEERIQFEVFFQLFEEYVDTSLAQWALDQLGGGSPSNVHAFLAELAEANPSVNLATTNFDRLLEDASKSLVSITLPMNPMVSSKGVFKLHGSIDQPTTTVISMRRIAAGLPEAAQQWLQNVAASSAIVYLGWSGNDFDIYPTIHKATGGSADVFTIRNQLQRESLAEYEDYHWRQVELQRKREVRIAVDYEQFLGALTKALGLTPLPSSTAPAKSLTDTSIPAGNEKSIRNYLLALLEYAGAAFHAKALLELIPADDVKSKSLERRVLQALGCLDDMASCSREAYASARGGKSREFERVDALSDWATARCNQRYVWHLISSRRASHMARKLVPSLTDTFEWDIKNRAMQHWAVGLEVIADIFARRHVPGSRLIRNTAERLFEEVIGQSNICGDMYRQLTCKLEIQRSRAFTRKKTDKAYVRDSVLACRELSQLGRGHDVTIYVERGATREILDTATPEERLYFATMVVRAMICAPLKGGGAMVLLKGLRLVKHVQLANDPTLFDECARLALAYGQLGLWKPFNRPGRSGNFDEIRRDGEALSVRVVDAEPEILRQLLS